MTSTVAGKTQYFTNIGGHLVKGPLVSSSFPEPLGHFQANFNKASLGKGDSSLFKEGQCPCYREIIVA